ncbi:MAG: hypothetical protein IPL36_03550 [Nigerium sp.]|nr:hypothetical protein [Nigerium sp.]
MTGVSLPAFRLLFQGGAFFLKRWRDEGLPPGYEAVVAAWDRRRPRDSRRPELLAAVTDAAHRGLPVLHVRADDHPAVGRR